MNNLNHESEQQMETTSEIRLIRLSEVLRLTAVSRSHIYALIAQKKFPRGIKLSERTVAWLLTDVHRWISDRIEDSNASPGQR